MAQSALTVTPPSPTPPTNMSFTGASPPNPPNYAKNTYNDPKNWGVGTPTYPPPFFDDGAAGALTAFAANTAALASGSGATAGGTEGSYPGAVNGAVPASTSVPHEGAGTEVVVTAPGSNVNCPTVMVSDLGSYTTVPNQQHASSMSPAVNPTLASIAPTTAVKGTGTQLITCTGTGSTPGCRIWANNVEQTTTFTNATTISATVKKPPDAGAWPIDVKLGGVPVLSTRTFTWT